MPEADAPHPVPGVRDGAIKQGKDPMEGTEPGHLPENRRERDATGAENDWLYVVDLGEAAGRRLERRAAMASYDSVEAFAALLICAALDREDREEEAARGGTGTGQGSVFPPGALDDDIPF